MGEPPLLLAGAAWMATKAAIRASRVERGLEPVFELNVPATVDRVQAAAGVTEAELTLDTAKLA